MLVTVGKHEKAHTCTDRFDLIGAPCLSAEPSDSSFGSDAVCARRQSTPTSLNDPIHVSTDSAEVEEPIGCT
jgi:hypothetical protein